MQGKHYRGRTYTRRPLAERLMARVEIGDECWEWQGHRMKPWGYGQILAEDGSLILTHRASYQIHVGPIAAGLLVLHTCDNPPCVRPEHLFLGTHADNVADMDAKGRRRTVILTGDDHWTHRSPERIPRGADTSRARLTWEQAEQVRRLHADGGVLQRELADRFGVSQVTISRIVRGVSYAP